MRIGYARVSTDDQRIDLQIDALSRANCDKIFTDQGVSGGVFTRQGLDGVLSTLKEGDTLIVWRLDRLGRSLVKLVELMNELGNRGAEFHSLTENIDTSSSGGRLVFHVMAALAEFERSLISERTRAGMEAARRKGKHLGRPPSLSLDQVKAIRHAFHSGDATPSSLSGEYGVSERTILRAIEAVGVEDDR